MSFVLIVRRALKLGDFMMHLFMHIMFAHALKRASQSIRPPVIAVECVMHQNEINAQ